MTVCVIGRVVGSARTKILDKTPWGNITQQRSTQVLVGWDDALDQLVVIPFSDQFAPEDVPVYDTDTLDAHDLNDFRVTPSSVKKHTKCTRPEFSIDSVWKARGATFEKVPKSDSSFSLGKSPGKMGRKESKKRRV